MIKIDQIVNKDLVSTGLNQLWRIISGPLTMIMIPLYLTPEAQGYWYMFISLAALAIFADLGFSNIILQFSAHEFAYLKFDEDDKITGNEEHLKKLAAFMRFCIKWLIMIILIVFPVIVSVGFYYLSLKSTNVEWVKPWLIYSISSGIVFFCSSLLFFFEGCNLVSKVQLIRFKIAIATSLITIVGLFLNFQLYAIAISLLVSGILGLYFLVLNFKIPIYQLWIISSTYKYSWFKEFISLLWRYAISWSSGYFLFQLFTPIVFCFYGAVEAGKVGISIALWTALYSISNSWIMAITPKLNMCIAKKEWSKLHEIFNKNLFRSLGTFIIGALIAFILFLTMQNQMAVIDRFVNVVSLAILGVSWLCQLYVNSVAVYLRAYKQEPLMIISIISALYVASFTYLSAQFFDVKFIFIGYLSSYIYILPYVIYLYNKQRENCDAT